MGKGLKGNLLLKVNDFLPKMVPRVNSSNLLFEIPRYIFQRGSSVFPKLSVERD